MLMFFINSLFFSCMNYLFSVYPHFFCDKSPYLSIDFLLDCEWSFSNLDTNSLLQMLQKLLRLKLSYTISMVSFYLDFLFLKPSCSQLVFSLFLLLTVSIHFIGLYSRTMLKIMMDLLIITLD